MKPTFAVCGLALASLFFGVSLAPAQEPTQKEALAAQLLDELHTQKIMDTAFDSMSKMQSQMMAGQKMTPEQQAKFAKTMQKSMDAAKQAMDWNTIKPIFVKIYADNFDAADLQGLIDFYKTPVGQKFIEKQPVIQAQTMQAMGALVPKIQAAIRKGYTDAAAEKDGAAAPSATP